MEVEDQRVIQLDIRNNKTNFNLSNNHLNSTIQRHRTIRIKEYQKKKLMNQVIFSIVIKNNSKTDNHKQWKQKNNMLWSYNSKLLRNNNKNQLVSDVLHLRLDQHQEVHKVLVQRLSNLLTIMIQNFKKYYRKKEMSTRENLCNR